MWLRVLPGAELIGIHDVMHSIRCIIETDENHYHHGNSIQ